MYNSWTTFMLSCRSTHFVEFFKTVKFSLREREMYLLRHEKGENSKYKYWTNMNDFMLTDKYHYAASKNSTDSAVEHL